jgi:hypothetical protein
MQYNSKIVEMGKVGLEMVWGRLDGRGFGEIGWMGEGLL